MNYFIYILLNILLPIFIQIFLGYIIKKVTNFNNKPLAVIQLYIIIPALLFVSMYNAKIDRSIAIKISLHSIMIFILLYILSVIISKIFKYNKTTSSSFSNSICLYNSGNFCLPLVQILYNNPIAVSVQIVIMTVQSIVTNTVGIYSVSAGKKNVKQGIVEIMKVPMIYCIVLALLLRGMEINVAKPILNALNSLGSAMVPVALISLGAQLAETKYSFKMPKVYFSNFIRLVISPILAYGLVLLLGLKGMAAEIAVISSSAPTAVNAVLLAIQYDSDPEFASQAVFFSTIISSISVTFVIFLVVGRL
ncbi:AEC family transporter [Clostridium lacusfryxellense]|uniref:AEC family transporter n=1 Tax=Clostridium lacusfryxellense TaxID=205328 RepID=UPI001C0BB7A6|nr:AEC family transporter [Clostridium lacusfryxellense]MBU3113224.1 AEC family transporter [Clostridium lacusfryxellense]